MRRTSAIAVATMTAAALTLTACGRDSGGSAAAETGKDISSGKATGTITVWAMGAEGEKLPALAKDFEAANPGAKVNVTAIPWDAAHDKFTTAITAGKTPDAAMVGTTWMGEFAGLGALDPTPKSIDTSQFFEGAQNTTKVGDTSYGIPWYVETRLVYYRTDLAKKAGFTEAPKTWEELKAMAKGMQTKAGAKWGIGLQAGGTGSWQTVMPFAWSNGADLTKDGGKGYNFDSPEIKEAVDYYKSYFDEGISDKAAPATPTTEPDFASGKVPMFISGPWMMSAVEKVGGAGFKDKYAVAPMPTKKTSSSFVGGSDFVVFKNSKQRDTAWKFTQFLADPKTQAKWYTQSTDLPSVQSAWQDPSIAADKKLAVFGEQLKTAQAPPSFATWEQVVAQFDTELEKITKQDADTSASLKSVQSQAESIGTGQ
ncbi:ABC transporter substrate-binding protein [Phycicoccus sp. Root563]|uniref:sugar ABC transporter substrate-binding protein n=1 Tax=unclassified Phycicoccus TaxID=2637926 RepID=UPI0007035B38|nr:MULTISPECIES: sugar ABC transporter substrate-binding protein [unclassified Phycicoccus]KQU68105.1 ABC transporter substrate-binding protein [Phycicoccus sp. Root101]KQZ89961.1 ABC transporter substrate-binding protein [Phycicoccus sp. Root563]